MSTRAQEHQLLKKLTVAITENPRATTGELAQAAGISRATLNRFCGSRENLMRMIGSQAQTALDAIIRIAVSSEESADIALGKLINAHFENQEYLIFVCATHSSLDDEIWNDYLNALDTFVCRGQEAGIFRSDFSPQMLAEFLVSTICCVIDADRRGRAAIKNPTEMVLSFFLNGAEKS